MADRSVVFGGHPVTLVGPEIRPGDKAPEFSLVDPDLKEHHLGSTQGKIRLISVVPSLDTGVCNIQSRRFDQEAKQLSEDVVLVTVSMDLPFAQKRWQKEAGADRTVLLSDHREASFGTAYGTLIKGLRLEARATFVVDRAGVVRHAEYVPVVSEEPNYERALAAVRKAL